MDFGFPGLTDRDGYRKQASLLCFRNIKALSVADQLFRERLRKKRFKKPTVQDESNEEKTNIRASIVDCCL